MTIMAPTVDYLAKNLETTHHRNMKTLHGDNVVLLVSKEMSLV
jgi:hypothetical protein